MTVYSGSYIQLFKSLLPPRRADVGRDAKLISFLRLWPNACVHLYTCTAAVQLHAFYGAATRAVYTYDRTCRGGELLQQQQLGEDDEEAALRESRQERPSVRRRAAARRRGGRRHVGPCRARRFRQCRHFCQNPGGFIE